MNNSKLLLLVVIILSVSVLSPGALAISSSQDTDGDSIPDLTEDLNGNGVIDTGESNPYTADSDNGGESDGSEVAAKRNPLDQTDDLTFDTDGDGWVNGIELLHNTDPKIADTDHDGVNDPADPFPLNSKSSIDTNANKLPDEWESAMGLSALPTPQTVSDDPDSDGLKNAEELARGTNPLSMDTDHDGVEDQDEINAGTNPRENACLEYTAESGQLSDLSGHWASAYIETLKKVKILPDHTPLIRGYEVEKNGKIVSIFAPDQPVTRYEFLKMVLLSTCTKLRTYTDREPVEFLDVRKTAVINEQKDFAFRRYIIYTAAHFKIAEGYANGSFRPDDAVTRAEAVKILTRAANLNLLEGTGSVAATFSDVMPEDWFSPFVSLAASREIVQGYADGTFGPGKPITRAEAGKIIEVTMRQNPFINGYVLP